MILIPNSYGVLLQEFNACHEPGGSTKGGQFAPKGTCGTSGPSVTAYMAPHARERIQQVLGDRDPVEVAKALVAGSDEPFSAEIDSDGFQVQIHMRSATVSFERRLLKLADGSFWAQHDKFEIEEGHQGAAEAKQILQSHFRAYEALGVSKISTIADIDVGSYAWARAGFVPSDPLMTGTMVKARIRKMAERGLLTTQDADRLRAVVGDPPARHGEWMWDVADARVQTTPAEALAWVAAAAPQLAWSPDTMRVRRREAAKGIVNVGSLVLMDLPWKATLSLTNPRHRARVRTYYGV